MINYQSQEQYFKLLLLRTYTGRSTEHLELMNIIVLNTSLSERKEINHEPSDGVSENVQVIIIITYSIPTPGYLIRSQLSSNSLTKNVPFCHISTDRRSRLSTTHRLLMKFLEVFFQLQSILAVNTSRFLHLGRLTPFRVQDHNYRCP